MHSKKKPDKELNNNDDETENVEIATPKRRYISPEERKQIIEELRLVPKKYVRIKMDIFQRKITNYLKIRLAL